MFSSLLSKPKVQDDDEKTLFVMVKTKSQPAVSGMKNRKRKHKSASSQKSKKQNEEQKEAAKRSKSSTEARPRATTPAEKSEDLPVSDGNNSSRVSKNSSPRHKTVQQRCYDETEKPDCVAMREVGRQEEHKLQPIKEASKEVSKEISHEELNVQEAPKEISHEEPKLQEVPKEISKEEPKMQEGPKEISQEGSKMSPLKKVSQEGSKMSPSKNSSQDGSKMSPLKNFSSSTDVTPEGSKICPIKETLFDDSKMLPLKETNVQDFSNGWTVQQILILIACLYVFCLWFYFRFIRASRKRGWRRKSRGETRGGKSRKRRSVGWSWETWG